MFPFAALRRPRLRWKDNIKTDFRQVGWGRGLDQSGLGQQEVARCCECGNEFSSSIKCVEIRDQLNTSYFLRKDSAPWSQLICQFVWQFTARGFITMILNLEVYVRIVHQKIGNVEAYILFLNGRGNSRRMYQDGQSQDLPDAC